MNMSDLRDRGLVIIGCGRMGSALLQGWLDGGLPATAVTVVDPAPSDWLKAQGVNLNGPMPADPALVLVAVKPQVMADALPGLSALGNGRTVFLSVAAGVTLSGFEEALGAATPIIRAMPNTPAAVGRGITAVIANAATSQDQVALATELLSAVGEVVKLETESQMDAVTGVSGSGPAYVFHLVEALAVAGEAQGLSPDLAMKLARATVEGAGELLHRSPESAEQLRINVTSPNGTTAEALSVLMSEEDGMPVLMCRAVAAAADRSRALSK